MQAVTSCYINIDAKTILEQQFDSHKIAEDEPLPGYARIFIYDPFGNRVELIEPIRPKA